MYINYSEYNFESCEHSDRLISQLVITNNLSQRKINIPKIKQAIYCAKIYHQSQKRDSGEPYYTHPLAVASMVARYNFDTNLIIAAILHDTIEDTEATYESIEAMFGTEIAIYVQALSRIVGDQKISVEDSLKKICKLNNNGVLLIKLCDRLHNIQTIRVKSKEKISRTIDEVLKIFITLSFKIQNPELEKKIYELCITTFQKTTNYSKLFSQDSQNNLFHSQTIRLLES
jgi:(p)ppGpp synthase/HD superfamily hydrolase